jgi:hypothetical protein
VSIDGPVTRSVSATFCVPVMVATPAWVPSELKASSTAGVARVMSVASTAVHGVGSLTSVRKPTSRPVNAPAVWTWLLATGLPAPSCTVREVPCSRRGFVPAPGGSALKSIQVVQVGSRRQSQTSAPSSVPGDGARAALARGIEAQAISGLHATVEQPPIARSADGSEEQPLHHAAGVAALTIVEWRLAVSAHVGSALQRSGDQHRRSLPAKSALMDAPAVAVAALELVGEVARVKRPVEESARVRVAVVGLHPKFQLVHRLERRAIPPPGDLP